MKKLPFYPFLLAAFPILNLYAHNLGLFPFEDILRPLAIALVGVLLVFGLCWLLLKSSDRAATVAAVAVVEFFTFGYALSVYAWLYRTFWVGVADGPTFLPVWVGISLVALILSGWKWKRPGPPTQALNVAALVLICFPIFSIASGLLGIRRELAAIQGPATRGGTASNQMPDIYYIILDGYGRADALERYFGFDNAPFLSALTERGFYVAGKSRSNYCQTELSLSSSLNMRFVRDLVQEPQRKSDRVPLDRLIDRSAVAAFLRSHGYEYIAVTSGFPGIHPGSSDAWFKGRETYSLFESSLFNDTPLGGSRGMAESEYDARRRRLVAAFDNLADLGPRGLKPRFVFAHILAPHPPFVIGANGEPLRPSHTTFGYWDASAFFAVGGTQREYHDGYLSQLRYVNRRVLQLVDELERNSPVRPIIILQGDHGAREHLSQDSIAQSDLREAFRNLNAYLVPESVRRTLYQGITPVNSFRLLFNGLFDEKLPLLPDRSFFTTWDLPYEPVDVTEQVEKRLDPALTSDPHTRLRTTAE